MTIPATYPLGYSENEARRLAEQGAFLEDLTEDILRRAGLGAGMEVLDLGCGMGDVSLIASRLVGPSGAVLGVDRSATSVETARRRAAALGIRNIRFEVAELEAFASTRMFDAMIGRLILLYLPQPAVTLRRLSSFLRHDGVVAFQEIDTEECSQVPPSELFDRVRGWLLAAFGSSGAEMNMGSKLAPTFLEAGLPRPRMIASSRVESGPDSYAYAYLAQTLRSMLPLLERTRLVSIEEVGIESLAQRLRDDAAAAERVTFLPRMVGAWTRPPNILP